MNKLTKNMICYICEKELSNPANIDHIIPDKFIKGSGNKPKLPVHKSCNTKKSKEDQWFIQEIKFRCCLNENAGEEFQKFIQKADQENPNKEYIEDAPLRNYKLANTILNNIKDNGRVVINGKELFEIQISKESMLRMEEYLKLLCRGLFIYHYPGTNPKLFLFNIIPIYKIGTDKIIDKKMLGINQLLKYRNFYRECGDNVIYCGSWLVDNRDRGFVAIEFYKQLLAIAYF